MYKAYWKVKDSHVTPCMKQATEHKQIILGLLLWSSVTVICKIMTSYDNHVPVNFLF